VRDYEDFTVQKPAEPQGTISVGLNAQDLYAALHDGKKKKKKKKELTDFFLFSLCRKALLHAGSGQREGVA
jgi:hypothetical protein